MLNLYRQSGVIPYRVRDGQLEVLLITSLSKRRPIIPKGVVEPDMTPAASAAKEAWEEAGVEGEVSEPSIGSYSYKKWGGTCTVEVFLMRVTTIHATWPEQVRKRRWVAPEEAASLVDEPELAKMLEGLASRVRIE